MLDDTQFLYDDTGTPTFAVIPHEKYIELTKVYEASLSDEELFDAARSEDEEAFPAAVLDDLLAGVNPIKVYRKYRNLKQKELADLVNINPVYLSQIETGKRDGSIDVRRKIAAALRVDLDDMEA